MSLEIHAASRAVEVVPVKPLSAASKKLTFTKIGSAIAGKDIGAYREQAGIWRVLPESKRGHDTMKALGLFASPETDGETEYDNGTEATSLKEVYQLTKELAKIDPQIDTTLRRNFISKDGWYKFRPLETNWRASLYHDHPAYQLLPALYAEVPTRKQGIINLEQQLASLHKLHDIDQGYYQLPAYIADYI